MYIKWMHFYFYFYFYFQLLAPQTARKLKVFDEVKGWSSEATDVKYNNYMLLALIFDWFIELFVPFTSLCPNLNPPSFDIATSQKCIRYYINWTGRLGLSCLWPCSFTASLRRGMSSRIRNAFESSNCCYTPERKRYLGRSRPNFQPRNPQMLWTYVLR